MKILLLGEASFVHSTLRKGFSKLGHDVILMSDGNKLRDCPRDVDLKRDMRYGKLGGLLVLWKLLKNIRKLFGNDIVQIQNFQFLQLKVGWNRLLFILLKLGNKKLVKCCLTFDRIVYEGQAGGLLEYSDTHVYGEAINTALNNGRISEQMLPEYVRCCDYVNARADALLPCLYEYYVCYDLPANRGRLYYLPLPIEIPEDLSGCRIKVDGCVRVLVGIQKNRDHEKGAGIIADWIEKIAAANPGRIEVRRVYDVPYSEYLEMLGQSDVLVDQLYSYTPSMNSLAAMSQATVVVGGGEEEFYRFIGEDCLRPIVNVRPGDDALNMDILRGVLLDPSKIEELKRQGLKFVKKHHDYIKVCKMYLDVYSKVLGRSFTGCEG